MSSENCRKFIASLIFCLLCIPAFTNFAFSQENQNLVNSQTLDIANEINSEIMSPFCPGLLLRDCPSEKATELKNQILTKLEKDKLEKKQVISWLEQQFGSKIYSAPQMKGFGIVGWLMPAVFLLLGGFWIYKWTKKD